MTSPREKPLLSVRQALLVWALSAMVTALLGRLVMQWHRDGNTYGLAWALASSYYFGHLVLAILLTKGKLRLAFPLDRSWLDMLVVVTAPWLGPLIWWRKWKALHRSQGASG